MNGQTVAIVIALVSMVACGPNTALPSVSLAGTSTSSPATGAISGRVIDVVTGAPISTANVSTDPPTTLVTTGPDGSYLIANAKAGTYAVTVSKEGHFTKTVDIAVIAGKTTTADLHLVSEPTVTPTPTATPTINPSPTPPSPTTTLTPTPIPPLSGKGGGVIAIASERLGLVILNADGTQRSTLDWNAVTLSWSPDGQWLAYGMQEKNSGTSEIFKVRSDGTGYVNLTNNPASDLEPAWSPDGTRIAFISDRDGGQDIYIMNADGGRQTRLTTNMAVSTELGWGQVNAPAWSPDGQKIAFVSETPGYGGICVVDVDGRNLTNLSKDAISARDPNWSPDGQKIAFVSDVAFGAFVSKSDIFVMNPDGSGLINLTNNSANDWEPDWSPDGRRIVFTSDRNCCDNPTEMRSEIHVINADGSGLIRLSKYTGEFGFDFAPDWSPDGSRIAFIVLGWEAEKAWLVINADGSGRTSLYYDGSDYQSPRLAWRP